MMKSEKTMNREMIDLFRSYRENKRMLNKLAAEKATENMSVDYSKPAVVAGGGNGQENKVISILNNVDILSRKCFVVEKTIEHYIGDIEMQDIIRNLLLKNVNVMRYAIFHNQHYTTIYHLRNKILRVAQRWASKYHLTQDSIGSEEGELFAIKIE